MLKAKKLIKGTCMCMPIRFDVSLKVTTIHYYIFCLALSLVRMQECEPMEVHLAEKNNEEIKEENDRYEDDGDDDI